MNGRTILAVLLTLSLVVSCIIPFSRDTKKKLYEPLLGTWDMTSPYGTATLFFEMKDNMVTGKMFGDFGNVTLRNITFSDNTLKCDFSIDAEMEYINVNLTSTVEQDEMKGQAALDTGEMVPITAKKLKTQ